MHGIFAYIYHKFQPNVGNYTIRGWYGWVINGVDSLQSDWFHPCAQEHPIASMSPSKFSSYFDRPGEAKSSAGGEVSVKWGPRQ